MQWLLVHGGHVVAKRCTHAVVTLLVHDRHVVAKRCTHAVVTLLVHNYGGHVAAKRCTHAVVTLLVHMVDMWLLRGVHMQWLLCWYIW